MKLNKIRIKSIVETSSKRIQKTIDDFEIEAKKSLHYAISWYAIDVLEATNFKNLLRPFVLLIEEEDYTLEQLVSLCEKTKKDAMRFFKAGGFGPNSTSPISNLDNIAKGKVYGKMLEVVEYIEETLGHNVEE